MVQIKLMPITCKYLTNTLRPLSTVFKRKIRAKYKGPTRLDDAAKKQLSEIIFEIENDLEHASPKHPQVVLLRAVRNCLLDDLRENENLPGSYYPDCERVAAIIREKRRRGDPKRFAGSKCVHTDESQDEEEDDQDVSDVEDQDGN